MGSTCKILAIQGSFRKSGKTTTMLKYAARQAEKMGHNLTYINLFDKNIEYCKGCRKCMETTECIYKNDDMTEITKLIKEADVIILAAPVYWGNVPAVVKNLMDRMSGASMLETDYFPKPRLKGKRYILLTACNTRMPFAKLCGQSSGICRVVKEYFKTSGVKKIGTVICSNTGKYDGVPQKKYAKIDKLLMKCTNGF